MSIATIPDGMKILKGQLGFVAQTGPYYWHRDDAGSVRYGFHTDERHLNPNNVVHGGALIGFLDTIIGAAIVHQTKRGCATISLDTRFVAPAHAGKWIEGRVNIRKLTRSLAFADGEALSDGQLLVAATSVFKLFEEIKLTPAKT